MLSKNLTTGSSINVGKPVGVLNKLIGSSAMLAWYKDKPTGVLNRLADSGTILAWYQDKPVGVLNRPTGSGEILSKQVWLMHYYAHDS